MPLVDRKTLLGTTEFGKRQSPPVTGSRIRQLITQGRIWPIPRKVYDGRGGSWAIEENAIILDAPERQGLHKFLAKLQQGELTPGDVQQLFRESRYWMNRDDAVQ